MEDIGEMEVEGSGGELDEESGIEPFLSFLPPYILCNSTNYTKLPLCNNNKTVEVSASACLYLFFFLVVCIPTYGGVCVCVVCVCLGVCVGLCDLT